MKITVKEHPILSFYLSSAYIGINIFLFYMFPITNAQDLVLFIPAILVLIVVIVAFLISGKEVLRQYMDIVGW